MDFLSYKLIREELVSICLVILTIQRALASASCDFPAIFNFGDSNSDTGGLSAAFGPTPPPNGQTYFKGAAGRYSDGRLIIDFYAQSLGLPLLHAYLDSVGANFSHGANFATAGSTIRTQNTTFFQTGYSPISLNVQSWQFDQFVDRSQKAAKEASFKDLMPKSDYFSRGLYTIDIGQNDLTAAYFLNMTTDEVKAAVPDIIATFVTVVQNIYWQGARTFWIHNTGPFGCLPYVLDRLPLTAPQVDRAGCGSPFNSVAQYFNQKLKETVVQLRKDLPLASFTFVDVYSLKYKLLSQGTKHGFEHPLRACCGHGGKYNYNKKVWCGATKYVNGTTVVIGKACKDPSKSIIWDGIHFTEAANKWLFKQLVTGAFSDPPVPLSMACKTKEQ